MTRARVIGGVAFGAGLLFGTLGGEYGTFDWLQLKRDVRSETTAIERLRHEIDSLGRWAKAIESDSATQERVAREKFGMIRNGERLYRVVPMRAEGTEREP